MKIRGLTSLGKSGSRRLSYFYKKFADELVDYSFKTKNTKKINTITRKTKKPSSFHTSVEPCLNESIFQMVVEAARNARKDSGLSMGLENLNIKGELTGSGSVSNNDMGVEKSFRDYSGIEKSSRVSEFSANSELDDSSKIKGK